MVDIQSLTAEISPGIKKDRRRKIEITGQNYNGPALFHRAAIIIMCHEG